MFERVYVEISNICNLQCSFCPEVEREKKVISLDQFRIHINQVKPLTKQVCLHLMGEPLGHPQFNEIVKICDEENVRIFLTTNGTLIKRHAEILLNWKSLDQINFSVHSYFANTQRLSLFEYLNPILNFSKLACEYKKDFYINLRLWNLQSPHAQKDQNNEVIQLIENYFSVDVNKNVNVEIGKSKKITHKLYLHFDTEFEWPTLNREVISKSGTCYGLRKQLAIHANGDIVPCCLDKEAILKLGNINQMTVNQALKTDRAMKIKTGFENGQLIEELCQKCQYVTRF